jgi:hypothetical protein
MKVTGSDNFRQLWTAITQQLLAITIITENLEPVQLRWEFPNLDINCLYMLSLPLPLTTDLELHVQMMKSTAKQKGLLSCMPSVIIIRELHLACVILDVIVDSDCWFNVVDNNFCNNY